MEVFCLGSGIQHTDECAFLAPDDYTAALEAENELKEIENLCIACGFIMHDFEILSLFAIRDITSICYKEHIAS